MSVIKTIHSKLYQIRSDKISADSEQMRGYFPRFKSRCWDHSSLSSDGLGFQSWKELGRGEGGSGCPGRLVELQDLCVGDIDPRPSTDWCPRPAQ